MSRADRIDRTERVQDRTRQPQDFVAHLASDREGPQDCLEVFDRTLHNWKQAPYNLANPEEALACGCPLLVAAHCCEKCGHLAIEVRDEKRMYLSVSRPFAKDVRVDRLKDGTVEWLDDAQQRLKDLGIDSTAVINFFTGKWKEHEITTSGKGLARSLNGATMRAQKCITSARRHCPESRCIRREIYVGDFPFELHVRLNREQRNIRVQPSEALLFHSLKDGDGEVEEEYILSKVVLYECRLPDSGHYRVVERLGQLLEGNRGLLKVFKGNI